MSWPNFQLGYLWWFLSVSETQTSCLCLPNLSIILYAWQSCVGLSEIIVLCFSCRLQSSGSSMPRSQAARTGVSEMSGYSSGGSPASRRQLRSTSSAPHQGSVGNINSPSASGSEAPTVPSARSKKAREQDLVVQQTEQITKRIQDLLRVAKGQELTK